MSGHNAERWAYGQAAECTYMAEIKPRATDAYLLPATASPRKMAFVAMTDQRQKEFLTKTVQPASRAKSA